MNAEMVTAEPEVEEETSRTLNIPELVCGGLVTALTTWSLAAIALAQLGLFQTWTQLIDGLITGAAGLVF